MQDTELEFKKLENKIRGLCYEIDDLYTLENPNITAFNTEIFPKAVIYINSEWIEVEPVYLPFKYKGVYLKVPYE